MAKRVGFEPTVRLPVQRFSRPLTTVPTVPLAASIAVCMALPRGLLFGLSESHQTTLCGSLARSSPLSGLLRLARPSPVVCSGCLVARRAASALYKKLVKKSSEVGDFSTPGAAGLRLALGALPAPLRQCWPHRCGVRQAMRPPWSCILRQRKSLRKKRMTQ